MFNWQQLLGRTGKGTIVLVTISVLVSLLTWWGRNEYTQWIIFDWQAILSGEIWRLVSPIFLHFMIASLPIHLLFNMMWLWDLGGSIEKAKNWNYLILLVLIIGIGSNLVQYFGNQIMYGEVFASYRIFGGMSGVVYGLLGFLFVRRRFDPFFPVRLNDAIMKFMLFWLVLGFTGLIGNIANLAHLSGLILGAGLGYFTAKTKKF